MFETAGRNGTSLKSNMSGKKNVDFFVCLIIIDLFVFNVNSRCVIIFICWLIIFFWGGEEFFEMELIGFVVVFQVGLNGSTSF